MSTADTNLVWTESSDAMVLPLDLYAPTTPNILLIDDDPMFNTIMKRVAYYKHTPLMSVRSVQDLPNPKLHTFDVAIVDYDLGSVTGVELAHYLESHCAMLPIVMISRSDRARNRHWPESVQNFVHKDLGPMAIMQAAIAASRH